MFVRQADLLFGQELVRQADGGLHILGVVRQIGCDVLVSSLKVIQFVKTPCQLVVDLHRVGCQCQCPGIACRGLVKLSERFMGLAQACIRAGILRLEFDDLFQVADGLGRFVPHEGNLGQVEIGPVEGGTLGNQFAAVALGQGVLFFVHQIAGLHGTHMVLDQVFGIFGAVRRHVFLDSAADIPKTLQTSACGLVQACLANLFLARRCLQYVTECLFHVLKPLRFLGCEIVQFMGVADEIVQFGPGRSDVLVLVADNACQGIDTVLGGFKALAQEMTVRGGQRAATETGRKILALDGRGDLNVQH